MKKIILLLLIFCFQQNIKAQSLTEISNYLLDSIDNRAATFAHKSFKEFMVQLKYPVKHYILAIPFPYTPDTIEVSRIVLYFESVEKIAYKQLDGYTSPRIEVFFTTPHRIPKKYFENNGILDWGTEWNDKKRDVLGYNIISHLFAR